MFLWCVWKACHISLFKWVSFLSYENCLHLQRVKGNQVKEPPLYMSAPTAVISYCPVGDSFPSVCTICWILIRNKVGVTYPSRSHRWPFPRLGAECLLLRGQEYIQAHLLVVCSELTQDQTEQKGTKCISHQQTCFSLPLSGVKLTNLNENLILQIVKNCGANVLPWFKVTAKF